MPKTERGYDTFDLLSALQKDIRRGKEDRAMFWAVELESFDEEGGRGVTMLWNALRTIASEDISIAQPMLPILIDSLKESYDYFKQKNDKKHRLFLAHAILALCRSGKSRIANNLVIYIYGERKFKGTKLQIPDYALDKHTGRGKAKKRDMEHFLDEGCKLRKVTVEDPYEEKAREILLKYGEP